MSGKSEVREWVKENRLALTQKQEMEWNDAICKKILSLRTIRQAFCVYCYVSFRHEAGTEKLITSLLEMGKYVAVPKVRSRGSGIWKAASWGLWSLNPVACASVTNSRRLLCRESHLTGKDTGSATAADITTVSSRKNRIIPDLVSPIRSSFSILCRQRPMTREWIW